MGTPGGSAQNMQLASRTSCHSMLSILKRYMNSRGTWKSSQKNYMGY